MHLKHLYLSNFKNYTETELDFCPRINCFVGNNGSGKTNLLDAIHYLSFSKSYFGTARITLPSVACTKWAIPKPK